MIHQAIKVCHQALSDCSCKTNGSSEIDLMQMRGRTEVALVQE